MNNYRTIKSHIFRNLQLKSEEFSVLSEKDIDKEISNTKTILKGADIIKLAVFGNDKISLTEVEFDRIKKELEALFDVKMEKGILIQGNEQQQRDTTWWTGEKKQTSDDYYWKRYKDELRKTLPLEVVKTIDDDTDVVMNNIENPVIENFNRLGMVVGHVQSGKTANYSSLICKAADAGYKFIVVIAGGINNLRDQTQDRLNRSFVGKDKGIQVGVGTGNSTPSKLPVSLTTVESDFNKQDANRNSQGLNFDNINTPVLLVIKKNTGTLSNVIEWLEQQYKNGVSKHAMLMVDDESDYASINYKEEEDPTSINSKLRKILSIFEKSCYVAYTATPYANIFIDHEATHNEYEKDLFPKDFIYSLDAPNNYFGARKIFLDTQGKHLVEISDYLDDIPANHKKDFELTSIPLSLKEAMYNFVLNIAIRHIRGQNDQHNSMLIHGTRFTAVHQRLAIHAGDFIRELKEDIHAYSKLSNSSSISNRIKTLETIYGKRNFINEKPKWQDVLNTINEIVSTIVIREVHQSVKTELRLEYKKERPTNVIVIGGTSLSRGYTLEGLSISYFLRNTIFYDTLMQMGRWFGYRIGYEDLCQIYLSSSMIDNFGNIIEATEDLIKDFKSMSNAKKTPFDFGLSVKQNPMSVMKITARNKQKNVKKFYFQMKLDGQLKETSWLSKDKTDKLENIRAIEKIVQTLNIKNSRELVKDNFLWRKVDKQIVLKFLNSFNFFTKDALGITTRMPIGFVKKYVESKDLKWDVALYGGIGEEYSIDGLIFKKEQRKAEIKDTHIEIQNRQVSAGNSESIALNKELQKELGSNRTAIRKKLENPLLMLHILKTNTDNTLGAFGVSFPINESEHNNETISLMINTVYYKNLLTELEEQYDD